MPYPSLEKGQHVCPDFTRMAHCFWTKEGSHFHSDKSRDILGGACFRWFVYQGVKVCEKWRDWSRLNGREMYLCCGMEWSNEKSSVIGRKKGNLTSSAGAMDSVSDFESGGCGFEPRVEYSFSPALYFSLTFSTYRARPTPTQSTSHAL